MVQQGRLVKDRENRVVRRWRLRPCVTTSKGNNSKKKEKKRANDLKAPLDFCSVFLFPMATVLSVKST